MNSFCALLALLSFLLVTTTIESRIGARGGFRNAIEKQPITQNMWQLMEEQFDNANEVDLSDDKNDKADCNDSETINLEFDMVKLEWKSSLSVYDSGELVDSSAVEDKPDSNEIGSIEYEWSTSTPSVYEDGEGLVESGAVEEKLDFNETDSIGFDMLESEWKTDGSIEDNGTVEVEDV